MNVYAKQKQSQRYGKQTCSYQGREGRGKTNQGYGINRHKILYIKQISNKDILHSTGNYIPYLKITYNGIQSAKMLNHYAIHLKLTQYCISTILQLKRKFRLFSVNGCQGQIRRNGCWRGGYQNLRRQAVRRASCRC